jgi:two-component system phosphate regulon sensor histidine kinase PhoR
MPPVQFIYNERSLEARARAIKQNKQPVAVALAIHDITEFQRLTRMRRDFVANISHELRTPVASIQLLSETLLKGALGDKKVARDLIEKIGVQSDILSQLAQELMDLSLIESGQTPLKLARYPLYQIAQAQVERLLPQAERKNLTVELEIADDVKALVDETMIGRVIGNLLHNAIKFTDTGHITILADPADIRADEAGDAWITMRVADTGIGLPPQEIDRIFERFYKIDQARSRKKSGTGLGLSIAKHVIEAHGGRIWAESDGMTGTTFYFTLPVEEEPLAEAEVVETEDAAEDEEALIEE